MQGPDVRSASGPAVACSTAVSHCFLLHTSDASFCVEVIGKASFCELCHVNLCCLKYVALLSREQLDLSLLLFFAALLQ